MSQDKIEGISKVSETYKSQNQDTGEQSGTDQFKNLMDSQNSIQTAFERLDAKDLAVSGIDTKNTEAHAALPDADVSSQRMGSATDQEQKREQQGSDSEDSDETKAVSGVDAADKKRNISSLEHQERSSSSKPITLDDIKKQSHEIVTKLEEAKAPLTQASQNNLEIKSSYQKLLRNHLTHIDDNIKIASSKVGVEPTGEVKPVESAGSSAAVRLLDMLTRTQAEMHNLEKTIEVSGVGQDMNPGKMLAMQVKLQLVTHEIELFTNLLNKALEATKTIMNVQV